jgi:hypothetical protein
MDKKIAEILRRYTKHKHIFLAQRGNKAILTALKIAREINPKKYILVPDQGGWLTHLQYPNKLKFVIKRLKTDYGILDLKELEKNTKDASALVFENPAGYFAEQPLKEIYSICKKNDCLVILDASGSVGSELCNGNYADMIVASFGRWKPINLEYGGFISFNNENFLIKDILKELEFDESKRGELLLKLRNVGNRYNNFQTINKKIKSDLKNYSILHADKKGINVVIRFGSEKEKDDIISYCEKNKYQFLICPSYIRVNEDAVSIEVKRS